MIYKNDFKSFLESYLGHIKETPKNYIVRCPYCEVDKNKKHYHMYISLESPIFHCFYSKCNESGTIGKLIKKLQGNDTSEKYLDGEKLKESKERLIKLNVNKIETKNIIVPELREDFFTNKRLYLKKRLKLQNIDLNTIHGLVFNINEFIQINHIKLEEKINRILPYLHENFIGFLTEHGSVLMCRNIDPNSNFKHLKIKVQDSNYLDYYKLSGQKFNSTNVILSEGIYNILNENIFDTTGLKKDSALYATALSAGYSFLLSSIVFNENIYRMDLNILSDRDVPLEKYRELKKFNNHLINSLTVWYNKVNKDFAMSPCVPERFII